MTTQTAIDLTPFCGPAGSRYAMDKPFVRNFWQHATNGSIICSLSADGEQDTITEKQTPDISVIYQTMPDAGFEPWPDAKYVEAIKPCEKCDGSGYHHHRDCDDCDGQGETECPQCGNEDECKTCRGKGVIGCGKCEACDGKKELMQPYYTLVGGKAIAAKYDRLIRDLPNPTFAHAAKGDAVFFRFDGGKGCVMPLSIG